MPELGDLLDDGLVGPPKGPGAAWSERYGHAMAWFRSHERWVFLATVVFQLLVLSAMVAGNAIPYRGADVVLLKVEPVDPRDLFRGDYVILGYDITRIPPQGVAGLPRPMVPSNALEWKGRTVYVTLEPEGDVEHYRGGPVSTVPPPAGTKFIQGTMVDTWRIRFGIESFFVQEGKGKRYEEAIRERRLWAEVALSPSGKAALRGLKIE